MTPHPDTDDAKIAAWLAKNEPIRFPPADCAPAWSIEDEIGPRVVAWASACFVGNRAMRF